ncbi:hypothetical protein Drorol1_Dr00008946 [Drosera rotundifolia]
MVHIENETSQPEGSTKSVGYAARAHHAGQEGEDDDPMVLENWFGDIEKLYKLVGCPEKLKVSFRVYYLEGEANNWWTTVAERVELHNFGWEQLKELIRDRYY